MLPLSSTSQPHPLTHTHSPTHAHYHRKKKKKRHREESAEEEAAAAATHYKDGDEEVDGGGEAAAASASAPTQEKDDGLTETQRRHIAKMKEREKKNIKKLVSKSHRERIDEFNAYLSVLTEHNDIPRVSAAGNG